MTTKTSHSASNLTAVALTGHTPITVYRLKNEYHVLIEDVFNSLGFKKGSGPLYKTLKGNFKCKRASFVHPTITELTFTNKWSLPISQLRKWLKSLNSYDANIKTALELFRGTLVEEIRKVVESNAKAAAKVMHPKTVSKAKVVAKVKTKAKVKSKAKVKTVAKVKTKAKSVPIETRAVSEVKADIVPINSEPSTVDQFVNFAALKGCGKAKNYRDNAISDYTLLEIISKYNNDTAVFNVTDKQVLRMAQGSSEKTVLAGMSLGISVTEICSYVARDIKDVLEVFSALEPFPLESDGKAEKVA